MPCSGGRPTTGAYRARPTPPSPTKRTPFTSALSPPSSSPRSTAWASCPKKKALLADLQFYLDQQGFHALALSLAAARLAGRLPGLHRDPFDRLLIAQSLLEGIPLVSNDTKSG
jgi:hypothetical protein